MLRENRRRTVAAWLILACLVAFVPPATVAGPMTQAGGDEDGGARLEVPTLFERVWDNLQSLWQSMGVFIDPSG